MIWNDKVKKAAGIALAAAFLFSGCGIMPKEEQTLAPPLIKPQKQEYEVYEVTRKDITRMVHGNGKLISMDENNLFPKENGKRVKRVKVKYGQIVKVGDILVEFDSGNIEREIRLQKFEVEKAQIRYERIMQGNDEYEKKLAKIDLEEAKERLNGMQEQLSDSKLTAAVSGMVTFVESLKEGDVVEAYKTLVTVSNPNRLQVVYQSTDMSKVSVGMKAELSFNGQKYDGIVAELPQSGSYKDCLIVNFNKDFADGQIGDTVEIAITIETKKNVIVVPKAAVKNFMGSNTVEVIDGSKKISLDVEKGIETNSEVEILSGLKEGQKVIVK